ncbi:MAG: hypothetical protein NVS2B12_04090 [Ktedonobacteraceae bacterium]
MSNEDYLKQKNIAVDSTTYRELLQVLESYGSNRWWVSENPRARAYYQTMDETSPFIIPYRQYMQDLGVLLGREVQLYEIRMSNKTELKQEVERAWAQDLSTQNTSYSSSH